MLKVDHANVKVKYLDVAYHTCIDTNRNSHATLVSIQSIGLKFESKRLTETKVHMRMQRTPQQNQRISSNESQPQKEKNWMDAQYVSDCIYETIVN